MVTNDKWNQRWLIGRPVLCDNVKIKSNVHARGLAATVCLKEFRLRNNWGDKMLRFSGHPIYNARNSLSRHCDGRQNSPVLFLFLMIISLRRQRVHWTEEKRRALVVTRRLYCHFPFLLLLLLGSAFVNSVGEGTVPRPEQYTLRPSSFLAVEGERERERKNHCSQSFYSTQGEGTAALPGRGPHSQCSRLAVRTSRPSARLLNFSFFFLILYVRV